MLRVGAEAPAGFGGCPGGFNMRPGRDPLTWRKSSGAGRGVSPLCGESPSTPHTHSNTPRCSPLFPLPLRAAGGPGRHALRERRHALRERRPGGGLGPPALPSRPNTQGQGLAVAAASGGGQRPRWAAVTPRPSFDEHLRLRPFYSFRGPVRLGLNKNVSKIPSTKKNFLNFKN